MLDSERVLAHPFVTGELALGNLRQRESILAYLQNLPQATVARDTEVLRFISQEALYGYGIGYVDAHLLASVRLTAGGSLWTRDKRLHAIAGRFGLAAAL
jgi:predicted nucleic acid-binding protein